eukprot:6471685-Amphidinium_carterae.3
MRTNSSVAGSVAKRCFQSETACTQDNLLDLPHAAKRLPPQSPGVLLVRILESSCSQRCQKTSCTVARPLWDPASQSVRAWFGSAIASLMFSTLGVTLKY